MASSCEHGHEPPGHPMAEVVGSQLLTAEASLFGIFGGKSGIGTSFSQELWFASLSIIPPQLHAHSLITDAT